MSGVSICFVLALSTAVAAAQVGRLVKVTQRNSLFIMSKEMALGKERVQPNQDKGRAIERRYDLDGLKEASRNKRYHLPAQNEMDRKYQLKGSNNAFLIRISAGWNTMALKHPIPRSCWCLHYTKCPRKSSRPRSLPQEEYSGFTDSMIIQQAVLQALGF